MAPGGKGGLAAAAQRTWPVLVPALLLVGCATRHEPPAAPPPSPPPETPRAPVVVGLVTAVQGAVEVQPGGAAEPYPAVPGAELRSGDRVEAKAGGRAVVLLNDGQRAVVRVGQTLSCPFLADEPLASPEQAAVAAEEDPCPMVLASIGGFFSGSEVEPPHLVEPVATAVTSWPTLRWQAARPNRRVRTQTIIVADDAGEILGSSHTQILLQPTPRAGTSFRPWPAPAGRGGKGCRPLYDHTYRWSLEYTDVAGGDMISVWPWDATEPWRCWFQVLDPGTVQAVHAAAQAIQAGTSDGAKDPAADFWLAKLYYDNHLLVQADQACRRMLAADPGRIGAHLLLGRIGVLRRNEALALREAEAVLAIDPANDAALELACSTLTPDEQFGDYTPAPAWLARARAEGVATGSFRRQLALARVGGLDDAQALVERFPNEPAAHHLLGTVVEVAAYKPTFNGLPSLQRAVELDPSNFTYWLHLRLALAYLTSLNDRVDEAALKACLTGSLDAAKRYGIPNDPPAVDPVQFAQSMLPWNDEVKACPQIESWPEVRAWHSLLVELLARYEAHPGA